MLHLLPSNNYAWMDEKGFKDLDRINMSLHQETSYIGEVMTPYPKEIHEKTTSFVLASETKNIILSRALATFKENLESSQRLDKAKRYHPTKLLATFDKRENYVLPFVWK